MKVAIAIRIIGNEAEEPHITELDEKETALFLKRWIKPYMDNPTPEGVPMMPMPETGWDEEVIGEANIGRIRVAMREEIARDLTLFLNSTEPSDMDAFLEMVKPKE